MLRKTTSALMLCAVATSAFAQGMAEDYQRAYQLRDSFSMRKVLYRSVDVKWDEQGHGFWYSTNGRDTITGRDTMLCYRVDIEQGLKQAIERPKEERPQMMPRPEGEHYWSETDDERRGPIVESPDGKLEALKYGDDILVREKSTRKTIMQTHDASEGCYYSAYMQFSPDGKKLATMKIDAAPKHYIYYVDAIPQDQFQPKLCKQEYQKPGDKVMQKTPVIFDLSGVVDDGEGEVKTLIADYGQIANQFELGWLRWHPDGNEITFEYNQRGHKLYALMGMDAQTGALRTIADNSSDKYVNWTRQYRYHSSGGDTLIWSSERDNYNHLYLYDVTTGSMIRQITKGEWYVRDVIAVDEEEGVIYFSANGMGYKNKGKTMGADYSNKPEDPYHIHYYRINFDGSGLVDLTPAEANHRATISPDNKYIVDTYSSIALSPVTEVRRADDGELVMQLEVADASRVVANGWKAPEVFVAPGRDGTTDMWGLIFRPTNYDPSKKYPVIDYIYSGPGDQYVPKDYHTYDWYGTSLAELGFIVVMVDGMTTSFRSKSFEEVCYKNLYDSGLPDHIAWIKAAAKEDPAMDIDNVGIFGCSAGGQEAMSAIIQWPDFYKAAYAASGCHDNRMDKIWWNEQWLGYPVDSCYIECSNIENADKVSRPLMLCWGGLDDNVDPSTTLKVIGALQKANKDFEMIVIPDAHHTMGEEWGEHKMYDFFVKHLMHRDPPAWNEIATQ